MYTQQNDVVDSSTVTAADKDKLGMATIKAWSILLAPAYVQLLHRNRDINEDFKFPYRKTRGSFIETIDIVENTTQDANEPLPNDNDKPVLSKNKGMIYHLKHTKNSLSLN